MAIKIQNSTIIDDSRNIVDAGIATAVYFDGFFPGGDKVYDQSVTVNNERTNIVLESDIIVDSGDTLTVSSGSTIVLNPFDFEKSSVDELLIDRKLVVGVSSSFDVVSSGVGSVGITSTKLVGFGTVLPPNIESGLLVKPIPGIIGAGTTVVSFVAAGSSTGVSTITISPASLNTTVQENIIFKFGSYGENKSAIILDGETGTIKSGSNTVIIDGENNKISIGNVDLDGSDGAFSVTANGNERLRVDSSGRLGIGTLTPSTTLDVNGTITTGTITTGIIRPGAGTTAAPSISPTGDTNTGIFFPSPDTIAFAEGGVEAARITSDGYLRMAANTGGIQFNGDTAAVNALDDYEEGTHTATLTPSTSGSITLNSSFQTLTYTKIGRLVSIRGTLIASSSSSPVGYVTVSLPFTPAAVSGIGYAGGSVFVDDATGVNANQFVLAIFTNGARIYLGDNTGLQSDSAQAIASSGQVYLEMNYHV